MKVRWRRMMRQEMFSPTKPQTVSVFFAGVIRVGGGDERAARWDFTFSIWMYSWFSLCIRMTSEKVCTVLPDSLSSGSRLINITFVMKTDIQIRRCAFCPILNKPQTQQTRFIRQPWTKMHIKRLRLPMGNKGTMHTFLSCCIDMSRRKVLEAPSRVTSATSFLYWLP